MEETKGATFNEMKEDNPEALSAHELSSPLDYKKIPLRNNKKEIIDYALVSNEDFEEVNKYKWHICNLDNGYKRVQGMVNKKTTRLSHFIKGKPEKGKVVDHKNRNSLDNRRENLRFATDEQNSQNRTPQKNTSSKYLGVFYRKDCDKWRAECGKYNLGTFKEELYAAKAYDTAAFIIYGEHASTNNLVKYEDTINLKIEDVIRTRQRTKNIDLPDYIYKTDNDRYFVEMTYDKKKYFSGYKKTIEEAKEYLEYCKKDIEKINKEKELKHLSKEITRNEDGEAVIYLYNKDKEKIAETIVDEELWYELSKIGWCLSQGYISGSIDKKNTRLHRYLKDAPDDKFVDHIDGNPLNNKKSNLRLADEKENSYNKNKSVNTANTYKGVTIKKDNNLNPYNASIIKDSITYHIGNFNTEIKAAIGYNLKAVELFGEFANINKIDIPEEKYNKIKEEVIYQINNKKTYIGTTKRPSNKFYARYKQENLGTYDNEIKAALAHNLKKIELNNNKIDGLKLNELDLDNETYEKYKKEIYEVWSNLS
jgi:hypothetical protein